MPAEPFIGQIMPLGPNFAPRGWAFCEGQLLAVASNDALFAVIGTIYGGDGRTTFGLPDLRGRVPIHAGTGPGLSQVRLGQKLGLENVTLNGNQLAAHTHTATTALSVQATTDEGDQTLPSATNRLAAAKLPATGTDVNLYRAGAGDTTLGGLSVAAAVTNAGGSQNHTNVQPSLVITYVIALTGVFPSRT